MKYLLLLLTVVVCACKEPVKQTETSVALGELNAVAQDFDLTVVDFKGLQPYLHKTGDKIYVVNFWATWCAPCVKELPYFEKLNIDYNNVEVILVSLDFPKHYDSKLKPFITKHKLQSEVIAFDDVDPNTWIPAIAEAWTGAIPATIIYNTNKCEFFERSFTYTELQAEIERFIK